MMGFHAARRGNGGSRTPGSTSIVRPRGLLAMAALVGVLVTVSCVPSGESGTTASAVGATTPPVAGCADVLEAEIDSSGDTFRVSVTILSADTGWEKYADAWEVRALDGTVLGTRILAHPHVDEQPFTRSLNGVDIPSAVKEVEIAARDSVAGFCGETLIVAVPGR